MRSPEVLCTCGGTPGAPWASRGVRRVTAFYTSTKTLSRVAIFRGDVGHPCRANADTDVAICSRL